MVIKGVFLSGWEYNRLLQKDPLKPRNSALPAEILWNGASQLWLFENVYCTKESFLNEQSAGKIIGWATGKIFADLKKEGVLIPLDWQKFDEPMKQKLRARHRTLSNKGGAAQVRQWIKEKKSAELEAVKKELLRPILEERGLLSGLSPSGKHWGSGRGNRWI